jgi:hypothetical protein
MTDMQELAPAERRSFNEKTVLCFRLCESDSW